MKAKTNFIELQNNGLVFVFTPNPSEETAVNPYPIIDNIDITNSNYAHVRHYVDGFYCCGCILNTKSENTPFFRFSPRDNDCNTLDRVAEKMEKMTK